MTLKHHEHEGYMYQDDLKQQIELDCWEECKVEIQQVRERRHKLVLNRQISKFNKLLEEKYQETPYYHSGCTNAKVLTNEKGLDTHRKVNKKWVINLSSVSLTEGQQSLLEHGPNFAITPTRPPYGEYIKAIETACQSLDPNYAEELRSDVYRVLRHPHQLRTNLNK